jgi:tetratricopeptide (TPR) repeat protein
MLRVVVRVAATMAAVGWLFVSATTPAEFGALERAIAADPENLRLAADYRQAIVRAADFDRAIQFFDQLAKRTRGSNVHISLALAYVDKVPTAGEIRRLYLGRDAMTALTKAIDRQPTVLAYYMRGLINLYYNNFIFHRVPRGIADLEHARAMVTGATPPMLVCRVYAALGDGHYRINEIAAARDVWRTGLQRFPSDPDLKARLAADDRRLHDIVTDALSPDRRVDTSLSGWLQAP